MAGVTGIVMSVGCQIDSYIVCTSWGRSGVHRRTQSTSRVPPLVPHDLAADLVSLLGALVLYMLAIGSVRGFALFLGISTVLDLLVSYFFMHPLVSILARNPRLVSMPGIGINAGLDAHDVAPVRTKVGVAP